MDTVQKVWLKAPDGETREVEATTEALAPLMTQGWLQIAPPQATEEEK